MRSLVAAAALLLAQVLQAAPLTPLEADLETLVARLVGEYDNHAQVAAQRVDRLDASLPWLHLSYRPVAAPALGPHVLLVTQARGGGGGEVYRRLLASFEPAEADATVVMRTWRVPAAMAVLSDLSRVRSDQLEAMPGCEVHWRREGGAFVGGSAPGACRARLEQPAIEVVLNDLARLDGDLLELTEWATDAEGRVVYGNPNAGPLRLRRCRSFSGWMAWKDVGSGDEEWIVRTDLEVHDQGDRVVVLDGDGIPTDLELELALVVPPGGSTPALRLGLFRQDGGEREVEALAWSDPDAEQIGMTLGWFQSGFARAADQPLPSADLLLLESWMTGAFSAAGERLVTSAVWTWRSDGRWLSVVRAAGDVPPRNDRRQVARIREIAAGLFELRLYDLPPDAASASPDRSPLDTLNPTMLVERPECSVLLDRHGDSFTGATRDASCDHPLDGGEPALAEITVARMSLTLQSHGGTAKHTLVWER